MLARNITQSRTTGPQKDHISAPLFLLYQPTKYPGRWGQTTRTATRTHKCYILAQTEQLVLFPVCCRKTPMILIAANGTCMLYTFVLHQGPALHTHTQLLSMEKPFGSHVSSLLVAQGYNNQKKLFDPSVYGHGC